MNDLISELINASQRIGKHVPKWTQGAGGNLSVKTPDGSIWIKASGSRLDQVSASKGLAEVDLKAFVSNFVKLLRKEGHSPDDEAEYAKLVRQAGKGAQASMELGFHAILPKRFVLHFHSLASLLIGYRWPREGAQFAKMIHGVDPSVQVSILDACLPGLVLTQKVEANSSSDIIILKNHGLILQGEQAEDLIDLWERIEESFFKSYPQFSSLGEDTDIETLSRKFASNSCKMRYYTPDSAVFADKLLGLSVADRDQTGNFFLKPDAAQTDRNVAEIWLGNAMLVAVEPGLDEFPREMQTATKNLPLEQDRKGMST